MKKRVNVKKGIIILIVMLIYLLFIHYRIHFTIFGPLGAISIGAILFSLGFFAFFKEKKIKIKDIKILYIIGIIFLAISFTFISIATIKHGLIEKIDFFLTCTKNILGMPFVYIAMIIAFPAFFFIMIGSYRILGKEHIYGWIIIFIAWIISNIRLFINYVLR